MIPIKLEVENFMSHSKSVLDFTSFKSALIVGEYDGNTDMSNGSGKSSIFEAIAWVLFGKSKIKYKNGVVKDGTLMCKVSLTFEHHDKIYKVVRCRHAKQASLNSIDFIEIQNSGVETLFKADTPSEVDEKIKEVISSNYEVFTNASYFRQSDISNFLLGTPSEKQKIISSILNLDRWNDYRDIADKKYKEIDKEIGLLNFKLLELSNVEETIDKTEKTLNANLSLKESVTKNIDSLNELITNLEIKLANIKSQDKNLADYHINKSKYENAALKLEELSKSLKHKSKEIDSCKFELNSNLESVKHSEMKITELTPVLELKNKIEIAPYEQKLLKGKASADLLRSQIENLKTNEVCHACGTIWEDVIRKNKEISLKTEELLQLESKISIAEDKIQAKRDKLSDIIKVEVEVEKYSNRIKNLQNNNKLHLLRIESLNNEVSLLEKSVAQFSEQKDYFSVLIKNVEKVFDEFELDKLNSKLAECKEKKIKNAEQLENLIHKIGGDTEKLRNLKAQLLSKSKTESELANLNLESITYSTLVKSFGRTGIQAIIIDNVIEELSRISNLQLNEFSSTPMYINFITQELNTQGSWKETLDLEIRTPAGIRNFDELSGGEQFRVAFAIRLALSYIQSRRMGGETQLLMLDEVSTSLDKHGIDIFISIIKKLEKDLKVLVITHDDNLKEEFSNIITVKKTGEDSTVIQ